MSETEKERAWYQNGWIVLIIVIVVTLLGPGYYREWQEYRKAHVMPYFSGRVNQPLFSNPNFEITVWHKHAGNLNNGMLFVTLDGEMADRKEKTVTKTYSFETWEPNEQNAVTLILPMRRFDPNQEIPIRVTLSAKNAKTYSYQTAWLGNRWKIMRRRFGAVTLKQILGEQD